MTAWPPKDLDDIRGRVAEWAAWYSGDRKALEAIGSDHGADYGTGLVGTITRVWRRFWGRRTSDPTQLDGQIKVHVPLAGDIARASADLLFAEPPAIVADKPDAPDLEDGQELPAEYTAAVAISEVTTDRLTKYLDDGLISTLAAAAEIAAALGGVYLRAAWDASGQRVFASRVDYDAAVPHFVWGKLAAVTFWRVLPSGDASTVWRHLEHHELGEPAGQDAEPVGIIVHELWQGSVNELGRLAPLTEHPDTTDLALLLNANGVISTLTPGLDVVHVPNVTPNPLWRTHRVGANLGAPDIAGCEDLLDRLDHIRSSVLEEFDLAKARITVPESWLTNLGPGKGQAFDNDQRIFTLLSAPPNDSTVKAELFQPLIRVEEHLRMEQQITEEILRRAGYSAATFGEDEDSDATATGVRARTKRSDLTRQRKLRHWQPCMVALLSKMLAIDVALGWADPAVDPSLVAVVFPEAQQTPIELATVVAQWHAANAASTYIRVATIHPDWDADEIKIEVDRITADTAVPELDPFASQFPQSDPFTPTAA